jgi:hypothetical protein
MNWIIPATALTALALAPTCVRAETPSPATCQGTIASGFVRDTTAAIIPGATLTLDNGQPLTSASDGSFRLPCLTRGEHHLHVDSPSFSPLDLTLTAPLRSPTLNLTLQPGEVQTTVDISADDTVAVSTTSSGPTQTLAGKQLQSLADDPDDLLKELQQLASVSGGNPANTPISVDGFNDSTTLPPKSSIAYIQINPDLYSAEYREPPFDGGRVNVYTKPGQSAYHGALFLTNGSPFENAHDPFSISSAPIGKQRYGFELSGPLRPHVRQGQGADFSLNLEHRSIDNFAVVNAITLNTAGNTLPVVANVATPQRLWIALARLDLQLSPRNTFTASYSGNINHLQNVGVGGSTLAEGGYHSETYDNTLRLSNVTVVNPHLMHEARLSLRSYRRSYLANSTAPQLEVAGAFTGGGNTIGNRLSYKLNTEFDDDAILTTKSHTLKFGTQMLLYSEHLNFPTTFNGSYTFGGGTAPVLDANNQPTGQTTTITGIEQYRRALLSLAGGTPTTYTAVTGNPHLRFNQLQDAVYLQDEWSLPHGLKIATGVRYFFQTDPTTLSAITPRLGVLWSPSKKGTWTLHAHIGTFAARFNDADEAEVLREDGTQRVTSTIYNPVYGSPSTSATPIYSYRQYNPHITTGSYVIENVGGTRALPHGFNLSTDFYLGRIWNMARTVNINSPLNGSPTGPRALGIANTDILEMQNSSQGSASVIFFGLEQHSFKRVQFFLGGVRVRQVDDNDDSDLTGPQSAFTNAGEIAPRTNQPTWNLFGNASVTLPAKLQLSGDLNAGGDAHYDITTGFDNNGDGNFNDRPAYAPAGSTAATPGVYATRYGLLTSSAIPGITPATYLRRNSGVMPWTIYLDTNLQRTFSLTHAKAEHPETLVVNLRAANVLNHLNVTSIGGVLGSPQFGIPYAADNGRRIEAGLRYTF